MMKDPKANPFELMEPASPESLVPGIGLWPWLVVAAVIVLAAIGIRIYLKRRRPAAVDLTAIRKAALDEAAAALANAKPESGRESAILTSLVLRKYLSVAAGDPALFETHEEFVSRQDSLTALTPDARAAAETGFTRLASLKYAAEIPEVDPAQVLSDSRALLETLHRGFAA